MKKWKKWVLIPVSVLVGLGLVGSGGSYWMVQRSLAVTSGEINSGVQKPVTLHRDDRGIPHILAENEHDLFYAQGYAQAQDRMWQMELARRTVRGGLAELYGEDFIQQDLFHRTIGFQRNAEAALEKIPATTKEALQAYTDGVNAYLKEGKLPVEYSVLRIDPEPWTLTDSLGISKYMAWVLGGNVTTELFLNTVAQKVGVDKALSLVEDYQKEKDSKQQSTAQVPAAQVSQDVRSGLLAVMDESRKHGIPGEGLGSNSWVVSGSRSQSGKPLLADDMHLTLQAPSYFYQNHLEIPNGYNVTGVSFPGAPGIIVGHNDRISWGFTNLGSDVQDLYIMRRNPDNPHQFEYNGKWEDARVIEEVIKVKGQDEPFRAETVITRHGPIISDVVERMGSRVKVSEPLAFKWTADQFTDEITAMLMFGKAKNWDEFEKGLRHFMAPAQNVIYADVDGNIAYRANGYIPVRKPGHHGLLPVPGWTNEYEWQSYVPWEELPFTMNPAEGYIATANDKVIAGYDRHHITYEYDVPYRAQRIKEMITEKDKLTLDDMGRMQSDWKNLQAIQFRDIWLPILERETSWNEEERQMLDTLKEWMKDPVDSPDLVGPSIYHAVYNQTMERLFSSQLSEQLYLDFISTGLVTNAMDSTYADPNPLWFQGTDDTKEKVLIDGFRNAHALLKKNLGDDPKKWQWGNWHTVTFVHPLGSVKPLHLLFNDGPYAYGGSHVTVGSASYSKKRNPYRAIVGAPWRFLIDMAEPAKARDVLQMGASGQIGSPHYKDQTPLWLKGEYRQMHYTRADIEANSENVLTLTPR